MIVSMRARQLSEQKGRLLDGESSERYITYAIDEIESQKLDIATSISRSRPHDASRVGAE
jgi:DNA-directed RNA polymerase subunit K/omega